jgi:penicillin amidase
MFIKNYGRGGTGNTPNSTSFSPIDFRVRSGGSWRFVVDTNDWDGARMTNAPGQSGDPRSKYYDNLLYGWANDASFPLYFSKEAILKNKDFIIELVPKNN